MAETSAENEPSIEEILESIRQIISEEGDEDSEESAADSGEPLDISAQQADGSAAKDKDVELDLAAHAASANEGPKDSGGEEIDLAAQTAAANKAADDNGGEEIDLAAQAAAANAASKDKDVDLDLADQAEDIASKDKGGAEVDLTPQEAPADKDVDLDLAPKEEAKDLGGGDDVLDLTDEVKEMDNASVDDIFADNNAAAAAPATEEAVTETAPAVETSGGDDLISEQTADAATEALSKLLTTNIAVEREYEGKVGNVTLEDIAKELMMPVIKTWLDQNLPGIIEKVVQKEVEKLARRALDK